MSAAIAAVAVALIAGPIMWALTRLDRRNTNQHAQNLDRLDRLNAKLDRHDAKLDRLTDRLEDHLEHGSHDARP